MLTDKPFVLICNVFFLIYTLKLKFWKKKIYFSAYLEFLSQEFPKNKHLYWVLIFYIIIWIVDRRLTGLHGTSGVPTVDDSAAYLRRKM